MTIRKLMLVAALAGFTWLAACKPTWYSIVLTPRGPVMERQISQPFGPEELERVAVLYSREIDADLLGKFEKKSVQETSLTATFGAAMPADSHNSGVYMFCDSPLGSASVYTERFGGRYDHAAMLRAQERNFNLFWDIVLLQLDALVGDSADYETLRSFLDTTMRADMWDLALEMTVSDLGKDSMSNLAWQDDIPDDTEEMLMRALHFLDERGYVTLQGMLGIDNGELDDDSWPYYSLRALGMAIGRRMGMQAGEMPAAFDALMDYPAERLDDAVGEFLQSDARVAGLLAAFREDFDGQGVADPWDSMELLFAQAFQFDFDLLTLGGDAREVTLFIPVEPYASNGAWVEASETAAESAGEPVEGSSKSYVQWQYPLARVAPGGDLAQVVFAFWAEPAEAYQVERFGARVLSEDALANQCRWRRLLGPSLRDEWDAFVDNLRPGPDLANTVLRFRFSIEDAPEPGGDPNAVDSRIARDVVNSIASKLRSPVPQQ